MSRRVVALLGVVVAASAAALALREVRAAREVPRPKVVQLRWLPSGSPGTLAYTVWRCAGDPAACGRPASPPDPADTRWRPVAHIAAADACATVPCSVHVDDASPPPVSYVVTARADGGASGPSNVLALGGAATDGGQSGR